MSFMYYDATKARERNKARFPFQYAGRKATSIRVNRGFREDAVKSSGKLVKVRVSVDTRQTTGDRTIEGSRFTKGRHPQESVSHYRARLGKD